MALKAPRRRWTLNKELPGSDGNPIARNGEEVSYCMSVAVSCPKAFEGKSYWPGKLFFDGRPRVVGQDEPLARSQQSAAKSVPVTCGSGERALIELVASGERVVVDTNVLDLSSIDQ